MEDSTAPGDEVLAAIQALLAPLKMQKYAVILVANGYDDVDDFNHMDAADDLRLRDALVEKDVPIGHIAKEIGHHKHYG